MEYVIQGKAPSLTQVRARAVSAVALGHDTISIQWGENCIDLEYSDCYETWIGQGWIRNISGDDLARELNAMKLVGVR